MRRPGVGFGTYLIGYMDAIAVPRKVLYEGEDRVMDASTLSRKVNGAEDWQDHEIFAIGIKIGEHVTASSSRSAERR